MFTWKTPREHILMTGVIDMVPYQQLQNIIEGFKTIARVDFSLFDLSVKCVVTTLDQEPKFEEALLQFITSVAESMEVSGNYFFKITDDDQIEYVLVINSTGENAYTIGQMAAFQLQNLVASFQEKYDKDNFMKNLLLDNLLSVDIHSGAQKLNIVQDSKRVCGIIEVLDGKVNQVVDYIKEVKELENIFTTAVDETNVVFVMDVEDSESNEVVAVNIEQLKNCLDKNECQNCKIAYGTIVNELKEVSRSYKESKMALDVGKIFLDERRILAYSELGIGRIIYQLPIPLCKIFIKEIFGEKNLDDFDADTNETIDKFFENSLNVSETSRQLFIHRNTLVYRLDKLQKLTNLDIRVFEDAITFKIAMMVVKYMKYMETY